MKITEIIVMKITAIYHTSLALSRFSSFNFAICSVLFLPRTVLLTEFVSDRRYFPDRIWNGSRCGAAVPGRTRHGQGSGNRMMANNA